MGEDKLNEIMDTFDLYHVTMMERDVLKLQCKFYEEKIKGLQKNLNEAEYDNSHWQALHADAEESIDRLVSACRAMMECAGPSDNWNGDTHEALRLIENAVAGVYGYATRGEE
jgi:peptidoglycan hydrolase-like protein with peptidoglycan-binding domain